jgi:hypothetical protein
MKLSRALLVLAVILAAAVGCGKDEKAGSSASEIFALRSQCAELGKKLLAGGVHGQDVQATQKSNYSQQINRCYVELDFSPADAARKIPPAPLATTMPICGCLTPRSAMTSMQKSPK